MRHFHPPMVAAIKEAGGQVLPLVDGSTDWANLDLMASNGGRNSLALCCRIHGNLVVVEIEDADRHESARCAMETMSASREIDFIAWYSIPRDAPNWIHPSIPNPEPANLP